MATRLRVKIDGGPEVRRRLRKMNPGINRQIVTAALTESILTVLRTAAREKILPGGKGPPRPGILTSRTGSLRRSLTANYAIDRSGLPRFIEGGSNLIYAPVHEFGGRFHPERPFLKPALEQDSPKFEQIFRKQWARLGEVSGT